jgi:type I restriction enzyme S subunit
MKDSCILWAGVVPENWQVVRLKECFIENNRRQPNKTVLSLSYGKIIEKDFFKKKGVTPASFDSYQGVHPGDVVLRLTDLQNDQKSLRVGYADMQGIITSAYLCVRGKGLHPKFSAYLLHDIGDIQNVFYGLGGGVRQSMKFADLAGILVLQLSRDEQCRIAAWLDIQTERIDKRLELLSKKRELLIELRQSVIDAAFTKGSKPDCQMKDSGIPWLGDIPINWSVLPLKKIVSKKITDGPHETPEFVENGIPFVSAEACSNGNINFDKIRGFISIEDHRRFSKKYKPQRNDIYLIKSGATTGQTAIVDVDTKFNIWSPLAAIRCNSQHHPLFVLYFLRSKRFQDEIARSWSFGTQQNIGMKVLEKMCIPSPPLDEQRSIANLLIDRCKPIEQQVTLIDQLEVLLKEQREAIIHEAVTGKIDLSGFDPHNSGRPLWPDQKRIFHGPRIQGKRLPARHLSALSDRTPARRAGLDSRQADGYRCGPLDRAGRFAALPAGGLPAQLRGLCQGGQGLWVG